MAGTSLLALIDDIASILDDVSAMTKVAAQKTSGVLGDDLALNAEQVSGVNADRELPVVWAVAKGSLINKVILVPLALALSYWAKFMIVPLLVLGGLFLCYEGAEKIFEKFFHHKTKNESSSNDVKVSNEKEKIKGAIRTDFILSAEIITISLGVTASAPFNVQILSLVLIALVMTVGVYGLVAMIVKIDDLGLHLVQSPSKFKIKLGQGILSFAPYLMKSLGMIGTVAMFMVGGGIIVDEIYALAGTHFAEMGLNQIQFLSWTFENLRFLYNILGGLFFGSVAVGLMHFIPKKKK